MSVYPAPEHPTPNYSAGFPMIRGTFTMYKLANAISEFAGRPIFDKTGLSDRYNLCLTFAPLSQATDLPAFTPPDLFTALREQLGLKLEPRKEAANVVVVDHIDRLPFDN
jgi:uncharacterized protein (TIGR03435 family)